MKKILLISLPILLFISGCVGDAAVEQQAALTPYGSTPTLDQPTQAPEEVETPLPTPTPTPQYHTVQAGETLSSIAYLYGRSLNDVLSANPEVNPNLMVAGMQVLIPSQTANTSNDLYAGTVAPIEIGEPQCTQEKSGGLWCFLIAENKNDTPVENVLVEMTIGDAAASQLDAQVASAPINIIPPGSKLPLAVYFPAPVPQPFRYSYELLSSIPVDNAERFLTYQIVGEEVSLLDGGLTAQAAFDVFVNGAVGNTVQIWMALSGYDSDGLAVGTRRIESEQILGEDGIIQIAGKVYSVGNAIQDIEAVFEIINIDQ